MRERHDEAREDGTDEAASSTSLTVLAVADKVLNALANMALEARKAVRKQRRNLIVAKRTRDPFVAGPGKRGRARAH